MSARATRTYYGLMWLAAVPVAVSAVVVRSHLLLGLTLLGIGFVLTGAMGIFAWRQSDEAAREAHKWAWTWGGGGGFLAATLVVAVLFPVLAREPVTFRFQDCAPVAAQAASGTLEQTCAGPRYIWRNDHRRTDGPVSAGPQLTIEGGRNAVLGLLFAAGLASGMLVFGLLQILGYGIAWLGWWRHKG